MNPVTEIRVLELSLNLLDDGKAWTQGSIARDKKGRSVSADFETAECWCAAGAVCKVGRDLGLRENQIYHVWDMLSFTAEQFYGKKTSLPVVNDTQDFDAVKTIYNIRLQQLRELTQ